MIKTQAEKDAFQDLINSIWCIYYPTAEMPIATLKGYLMALDDLTLCDIQTACKRAIKSSKFFPKPAELRELVESDGMYELLTTERIIEKYGAGGYIA